MATYNANLNEVVNVTTNTEANTIVLPNSVSHPGLSRGHWVTVKLKYGFSGFSTFISGNGNTVEDVDGRGLVTQAEMGFGWEGSRWVYDGASAWYRQEATPYAVPEMFAVVSSAVELLTDTPIPLQYDTTFQVDPVYWTVSGGNLECIRGFAGTINITIYYEWDTTANNQFCVGNVQLIPVLNASAQLTISPHNGATGSYFSGNRSGKFYSSHSIAVVVVAFPGDIVGLVGNELAGQGGTTYVLVGSGVISMAV